MSVDDSDDVEAEEQMSAKDIKRLIELYGEHFSARDLLCITADILMLEGIISPRTHLITRLPEWQHVRTGF